MEKYVTYIIFQFYREMLCTNHREAYYYFNKNEYENYNIMLIDIFFVLESQGSNFNDERMVGTRKWFLIFYVENIFNQFNLGMGRSQIYMGTTRIWRCQRALRAI